jgi:hypothetical protein
MNPLNYNPRKAGNRWVAYFDRLGFSAYTCANSLVEVFCEARSFLNKAAESASQEGRVECVWFSDTVIFYSTSCSGSWRSWCAVQNVSQCFFEELLYSGMPARGAMAFGEFYADKPKGVFIGKALVDAHDLGEKYDWLGFVLHNSVITQLTSPGSAPGTSPCNPLRGYAWWRPKWRDRKTGLIKTGAEPVQALIPNSSLHAVRDMASAAKCARHRRKYLNTIKFVEHFGGGGAPTPPRPLGRFAC